MHAPRLLRPEELNWKRLAQANKFALIFGAAPVTHSAAVRRLLSDAREGRQRLGTESKQELLRLLSGPTFLANLYYATKSYHPELWRDGHRCTPLELAEAYPPAALSAIVALSYLYKRARRLIDPYEWHDLCVPLETYVDIGACLGRHIPSIGECAGILGGAAAFLGWAALHAEDRDGFHRYRRALPVTQFLNDTAEYKRWGCCSYDIGACILVLTGFPTMYSTALSQGFSTEGTDSQLPGAAVFRSLRLCLDALSDEQVPCPASAAAIAEAKLKKECGSPLRWLARNRTDVTPDALPDLQGIDWQPAAAPSARSNGMPACCGYDDLPQRVRNELSAQEFDQLKHLALEEVLAMFDA